MIYTDKGTKNLMRTETHCYLHYRGFDFIKYISIQEHGVNFVVKPINSEEEIYRSLVIDEMFIDEALTDDLAMALDDWIATSTNELERVFVKLKAL